MLRSLAHVGVAGPETDETLHLRLLRAVDRTDVEVQAVLGRLAFRYGHEDHRRDTWSPSHLLHQIGRFLLPRRLRFSILSISRHRRPSRPFYTPSYRSPCVPSAWATATHVRALAAFTSARRRCFSISRPS